MTVEICDKIRIVILAGRLDFGRCPLASRLPAALWPIIDTPALVHVLKNLSSQAVSRADICFHGDRNLLQNHIGPVNSMHIELIDEPLPVGTAGCIREAAKKSRPQNDDLILALPAAMTCPPNIGTLIKAHQRAGADFTVVTNPDSQSTEKGTPAGIYICSKNVLEQIPEDGYFDITESLIPKLLRAGRAVRCVELDKPTGNFRNRVQYLSALKYYLESRPNLNTNLKYHKHNGSGPLWLAKDAKIAQSARLCGPVVVMNGARIGLEAIVLGPAVIGRNVTIGPGSIVNTSTIWDGARVEENCEITDSIVAYNAVLDEKSRVQDESIVSKPGRLWSGIFNKSQKSLTKWSEKVGSGINSFFSNMARALPVQISFENTRLPFIAAMTIPIFIAFLWSYWPNLKHIWEIWMRSDEYSAGLLVPFLALYVVWSRRDSLTKCKIKPAVFWGMTGLLLAQGFRFFGLYFMYGSAERFSIGVTIAALVLLLFGWQIFRKLLPVLAFMFLMLPWPNRVQATIAQPLQSWATTSAVFCLEVLGFGVVREGNIIHMGDSSVAVAEACNGLRMITAFLIVSTFVILLVKRKWWEKTLVLISSLPVALLCNTVRLTATSLAFTIVSGERWEIIFHDFGGYAMMPLALAAVVAELWLIRKLTVPPSEHQPIVIVRKS